MVLNALDLFGNCHFGHTVSPFWFVFFGKHNFAA